VRLVGCVWNLFDRVVTCCDGLLCLGPVDVVLVRNLMVAYDAGVELVGRCTRQSEPLEM
jgi:hypothetical protein